MARVHKSRAIKSALTSKGFKQDNRDHQYFIFYVGGKKTSIRTHISHGIKEYSGFILSAVRRQMKLKSNGQLDDFIDCPMGYEEYRTLLRDNGDINDS